MARCLDCSAFWEHKMHVFCKIENGLKSILPHFGRSSKKSCAINEKYIVSPCTYSTSNTVTYKKDKLLVSFIICKQFSVFLLHLVKF